MRLRRGYEQVAIVRQQFINLQNRLIFQTDVESEHRLISASMSSIGLPWEALVTNISKVGYETHCDACVSVARLCAPTAKEMSFCTWDSKSRR